MASEDDQADGLGRIPELGLALAGGSAGLPGPRALSSLLRMVAAWTWVALCLSAPYFLPGVRVFLFPL